MWTIRAPFFSTKLTTTVNTRTDSCLWPFQNWSRTRRAATWSPTCANCDPTKKLSINIRVWSWTVRVQYIYVCERSPKKKHCSNGYWTCVLLISLDCAAAVTGVLTTAGPSCTFYNVYPDGEVHWFRSSNDVWVEPSNSKHLTTKRVETGGYLTIQSNLTLLETVSGVVFNCSLKSSRSGKYIASTLIQSEGLEGRGGARMAPQFKNTAVRSQEVVAKALYVSVILAVLKTIS